MTVSTATVVRVRCRSSASVPDSTVRPARMIETRSHRASTSARMWLESRTVLPAALASRMTSWKTASISGSSPDGRLVEQQQLGVGGERGDDGDLLPVALGVGAALLGRVELEALDELGAPRSGPGRRAAGAEQVDGLAAGEVGPQLTSPGT